MSLSQRIFLFFTGILIFGYAAYADVPTLNKDLERIKAHIKYGRYKEALKDVEKIDQRILKLKKKKKPLPSAYDMAELNLCHAEAMGEFGYYYGADTLFKKALRFFKTADSGKPSEHYLSGALTAAHFFVDPGFAVKANEYLVIANNQLKASTKPDSFFVATANEVEILIGIRQGYFNETKPKIEKLIGFRERQLIKGVPFLDPETGIKMSSTRKKEFTQELRENYCNALLLRVELEHDRGNYRAADSLLKGTMRYIRDNVGKRSRPYIEALVMMGDKEYELGNYKEAFKHFRRAKSKALGGIFTKKIFEESHDKYLYILEMYSRTGFASDNFRQGSKGMENYSRIAEEYYLLGPEQRQISLLLKAYENEYLGRIEPELDVQLRKTFFVRNKLMPFRPETHERFLKYYYDLMFNKDSIKLCEHIVNELVRVKKLSYGTEAPRFQMAKLRRDMYEAEFFNKWKESYDDFAIGWEKVLRPQLLPQHRDYYTFLNMHAEVLQNNDYLKAAENKMIEAEAIIINKYGENSVQEARQEDKIANLFIETGKFSEAETRIAKAIEIFEDQKDGKRSMDFVKALRTEGRVFLMMGSYKAAERALDQSLNYRKRLYGEFSSFGAGVYDDLSQLLYLRGRYNEADGLLKELISFREKFGVLNQDLIDPLLLHGNIALNTGDFTEAEKRAKRAAEVAGTIFGDSSYRYWKCQLTLAHIYKTMGDLDRALSIAKKTVEVFQRVLGNEHIDVADAKTEYAIINHLAKRDPELTRKLLYSALDITQKDLGQEHPMYAQALKSLALFYIDRGKLDSGSNLLAQSASIYKQKFGSRNENYAEVVMLKGDLAKLQNKAGDALNFYEDAAGIYKSLFGEKHPGFVKAEGRVARIQYIRGDLADAIGTLNITTNTYKNYINEYFPYLSDREKNKYWNSIKGDFELYTSLAVNDAKGKYLGAALNQSMATKAVLLSSSVKVRNRILSSNDTNLVKLYRTWIGAKEQLAAATSMSPEQQKEAGLSPEKLNQEVESIEKSLSELSEEFAQSSDKTTYDWKALVKSLKPGQYAVDIQRCRVFTNTFTDSVFYVAFIVNNESKKGPISVILNEGFKMENRSLNYYRNCIRKTIEDKRSYQAYWAPIKAKIPDGATVLLSPDGVYNQINLETLLDEQGKFAIDRNDFILVSNLKDLLTPDPKGRKPAPLSAVIVGNPAFYSKTPSKVEENLLIEKNAYIDPLPGTMVETKELGKLLTRNAWTVSSYLERDAEEDKIKSIHNPRVFHVATHGFFLEKNKDSDEENLGLGGAEKLEDNPLLRSGLLLQGSGDLFKEQGGIKNLNRKQGVLTAYEAMNLDLDNTELVVLSACETGLGQVSQGEGVYGLQRSFQVSGAKNVVMSLFKVSDDATQKLMLTFYEKYLTTGKKHESFVEAKKELRKKFPEPLYWGSFVMLGK